jgi:ubiquinone/menaquinone biosynthesis C-methylase UbiE
MHERRYNGEISRLRSPQRIGLLEVERVVDLCLEGTAVCSVLDVGTGSGVFAEKFSEKGIDVGGIDPDVGMLEAAKDYVSKGTFKQGIAEKIPFDDKTFDLVFLGHVLHETDDIATAIGEAKRCAKKRVAVLEWPYIEEESGPPLEHRLRTEDILSAAAGAGFHHTEALQLKHMLLFRFTI